jgi:hypothetical protein
MTNDKNKPTGGKQAQPARKKSRRPKADAYLLDLLQKGNGTDPCGRKFILTNWPQSFLLAPKPNGTEYWEFTLQPPSADQKQLMVYTSEEYVLDATTGNIEAQFETASGGTQAVTLYPDGTQVIATTTKEGKLIEVLNADDAHLQRCATFNSCLVITETFNTEGQLRELATLEIRYPDASVVSFTKADTANPLYTGQHKSADGDVIEKALWNPSFELIQYEDLLGNATRAEMYARGKGDKPMPALTEGVYDRDRAVFTCADPVVAGQFRVTWIGQGRTETWRVDGSEQWEDPANSNAYAVVRPLRKGQSFREAEVNNEDGTGARLYADNSIECWTSTESFGREALPETLLQFVMAYAQVVDRRDVAEFYRQFRTQKDDMQTVIQMLTQFSLSILITKKQQDTLIATGLHEIAFPGDIFQGLCGSCNVTTVQRKMVVAHLKRVLSLMVSAVTDGYIIGKSGKRYNIFVANAIAAEASGRPIFCRLFQTVALQVVGYKRGRLFRTTQDGTGTWRKLDNGDLDFAGPLASGLTGQQVFPPEDETFEGLDTQLIAWILTELSGEDYGVVFLESLPDLEAELAKSGEVILVVDGRRLPINPNGPFSDGPLEADHVINVLNVVHLTNGKTLVLFENEWGAQYNHSTVETGVDAEEFLANCLMPYGQMEEQGAPKEGLCMEAIVRQNQSAKKRHTRTRRQAN